MTADRKRRRRSPVLLLGLALLFAILLLAGILFGAGAGAIVFWRATEIFRDHLPPGFDARATIIALGAFIGATTGGTFIILVLIQGRERR
jgi:hypothetical protein